MDENHSLIDAATHTEIIDIFLSQLREHYVFPDVAEKIAVSVRERLHDGAYDTFNDAKAFAATLTAHMYEVSNDKHLRIFYSPQELPMHMSEQEKLDQEAQDREFGPLFNFGFEKVERLPGNIGYLDFRLFYPPELAGEVAIAALNFLANTHALIVDLRKNHGGEPAMIALMCSYFFKAEPVHLNSLYWRATDSTQQFWTLPYVPGKRYLNKPIYVLTSHETFSGAEEFAYNLKNLKRATIIGETTGGGAHPGDVFRIDAHFGAFIPTGRAINPISGTNWEGTGVTPHIEVPQEDALKTAYSMALKKVLEGIGETPTELQKLLVEEIQKTLAEQESRPI
jgi:C-terminal processing protease CtpA/Prc